MSLIRIIDYFVKSRISYGLCCFLDKATLMNILETILVEHLRCIFGLPQNTSEKRLRLTIGEPRIVCRLAIRMLKIWRKYKMHFGEFPLFYEKLLRKYFNVDDELYPKPGVKLDFFKIKFQLINKDLKELSKESHGIEIRNDHRLTKSLIPYLLLAA